MDVQSAATIVLVFIGCCINVIVLEELTNSIPGIANLITFSQFLFISLEGFLFTTKCGTRKPAVPIKDCILLVLLFFVSSVCNNYAYNFNVPTTLHIILKSGSLVTNMGVGFFLMNKRYSEEKYYSCALVSLGIFICTLSSAKSINENAVFNTISIVWWTIGISLLIIALLIGAFMGILQENLYIKCGKHPKDVMFYTHILPLPLFMFLFDDISSAIKSCNNSHLILGIVPYSWILLLINVLTQYVCIKSVYVLTSECTSLTVNLVLTLRKFISLLFSIIVFQNTFYIQHWIGALLVFYGTCLYLGIVKLRNR